MRSIRRRLLIILLAATGLVWLSGVVRIRHSTRTEVEHVLDRRLQESAQMIASLIARSGGILPAETEALDQSAPALPATGHHDYARQLICQVWGFDGELKSESAGAPQSRLAGDGSGFSENRVDGETWRVYSHVDAAQGIRVMVGDARSMRDRLVSDASMGLIVPAVLILPLLAMLIWLAVGRGLAPLDRLAGALAARPATDLSPLGGEGAPRELRPMIDALDGLFRRVDAARDRERNFTAFAAHELKTPLAGLKTQAQIALIAPDAETRAHALTQIRSGVDRTDRMVRQLLDMTASEHPVAADGGAMQDAAQLLQDIADGLAGLAQSRGVTVRSEAAPGLWHTGQSALLAPALRNLIENALIASPPGAEVTLRLIRDGAELRFQVLDRGPGIADADRAHVTRRFWRGAAANAAPGSGLGLAIVEAVVARMGGELRLSPRPGGGEQAELILPVAG